MFFTRSLFRSRACVTSTQPGLRSMATAATDSQKSIVRAVVTDLFFENQETPVIVRKYDPKTQTRTAMTYTLGELNIDLVNKPSLIWGISRLERHAEKSGSFDVVKLDLKGKSYFVQINYSEGIVPNISVVHQADPMTHRIQPEIKLDHQCLVNIAKKLPQTDDLKAFIEFMMQNTSELEMREPCAEDILVMGQSRI